MGKETNAYTGSFEEQVRDQLLPYFEQLIVDDWINRLQGQIRLIHSDPDWWPNGEDDFKSFILELTTDIISAQRERGGDPIE